MVSIDTFVSEGRSQSRLSVWTTNDLCLNDRSARDAKPRGHSHEVSEGIGVHLLHHFAAVSLHCDLADTKRATDLLCPKNAWAHFFWRNCRFPLYVRSLSSVTRRRL
jgi:hypothetical protein